LNEDLKWEFYKKESGFIKAHGSDGDFKIIGDDYKIISPQYILVASGDRWTILTIDKKQNKLIPEDYKNIEHISGSKFNVCHFNSWQLINKEKIVLHNYLFDSLSFINEDLLQYKLNKSSGIIDFSGQEVKDSLRAVKFAPDQKTNPFNKEKNNQNYKLIIEHNKYGIVDSSSKIIIPCKYDSIAGPYENIFVVYTSGKMGIIDDKGIMISEAEKQYEKVFPFIEGRAKFMKAGKYGFIDQRGNVRVAPQYQNLRDYKDGLAAVTINRKWGFIDKDENIVIQPLYEEVSDFKNGMARVKIKGKWHLINNQDKIVENAYDEIKEAENNKWLVVKNDKLGLADVMGKELLAPRYKYFKDLGNGMVIVQKGEKWGVLDYNENFILSFEYDLVIYNSSKELFLVMKIGKKKEIDIVKFQ
jgi:hypothetical protein